MLDNRMTFNGRELQETVNKAWKSDAICEAGQFHFVLERRKHLKKAPG